MKKIVTTTFESADGHRRFPTESECLAYEREAEAVAVAMAEMPPAERGGSSDFANGSGYRQWPEGVVERTRARVLALAQVWFAVHGATIHGGVRLPHRGVMVMLQECGGDAIYCAASRAFYCIDHLWREWGQPYYAAHPEEGVQKEWEPEETT